MINKEEKGREMSTRILELLGTEAESLLSHGCKGIPKEMLHLPGPDFVDRVVAQPFEQIAPSARHPPEGQRAQGKVPRDLRLK